MNHQIDSQYQDILDVLEVKTDIPAQDYHDLCKDAADFASQRMVMGDEVEDQLYFPNDGVPGLNDIAHAMVTGFMQMDEDSGTITQAMIPDLVRLVFIAGDYSEEYREQAFSWIQAMTYEQALECHELIALWGMMGDGSRTMLSYQASILRLSENKEKLPLIEALLAGNDEDSKLAANALTSGSSIPGWDGFPFTSCAVRALLMRV
jgi:hypothetical protein